MTKLNASLCILATAFALMGCKDSNKTKGMDAAAKPARLNWAAIPQEFNPRTEDTGFRTDGFERIKLDIFGFDKDVEVVYAANIPANSAVLRMFTVYKKSASWGGLDVTSSGKDLKVQKYGYYECSIRTVNGQITELEGGCYVRLQLFLPSGSEIEVYNVGSLISRRFIPVDTKTFLENFDRASFAKDKYAAIDDFLSSYAGLGRSPSLTAQQLGEVIGDFMFADDKFKVLSRMHMYVSDRANIFKMIEDKFSYFDREKARQICGLR